MTEFNKTTRPESGPEGPRPSQAAREWEELLNGRRPPQRSGLPDLSLLFAFIDALRRAVPPELQEQFNSLVREVLLTVRALIDWYLERLERGTAEPQVEDIPIE